MSFTADSTFIFENPVYIIGSGAVGGPMEGKGRLASSFDKIYKDLLCDFNSWEDMEMNMQGDALFYATSKGDTTIDDLNLIIGGDLLNQITVTNFMAATLKRPFLGLYNACATMAESLAVASTLISGGFGNKIGVVVSSHNSTSERQYRYPTELGVQRPQTAQWTVTAAGSMVLSNEGSSDSPKITAATIGKVMDFGIKDPNDMGAAMAPAAWDTLKRHLKAMNTTIEDYDLILTGDLASHGHQIFKELCTKEKIPVDARFQDSGIWIYSDEQDVHSGGSGAGCSASVWSGFLLDEMKKGKYRHVLLIGTGALMSTTTSGQGHAIPTIAHAIEIEGGR